MVVASLLSVCCWVFCLRWVLVFAVVGVGLGCSVLVCWLEVLVI